MNDAFQALEDQYFLARQNLSRLMAAGATDEELEPVRRLVAQSRTNYLGSVKKFFHTDDPDVQKLLTEMNVEKLVLEHALTSLSKVADVLNALTKAVQVGSELAASGLVL